MKIQKIIYIILMFTFSCLNCSENIRKRHADSTTSSTSNACKALKTLNSRSQSPVLTHADIDINQLPTQELFTPQINEIQKSVYQCNQCPLKYRSNRALLAHKKTMHEGKRYTCEQCGAEFKWPSQLNTHKGIIHEGKRYTCEQCNKEFNNQDTLKYHKRATHEGKRYTCEQCNKEFNTRNALILHRIIHTDEKPYECDKDNCNYRSIQKGDFKKHISRMHTPISQRNVYQCNQCEHPPFMSISSLRIHKEVIHEEKCSMCEQCGKVFKYPSQVRRHKNKAHSDKEQAEIRNNQSNALESSSPGFDEQTEISNNQSNAPESSSPGFDPSELLNEPEYED